MEDRRARLAAAARQIAPLLEGTKRAPCPTGCAPIDAALHGGLSAGALHEVAAADHRATPAALGFLLALTAIAAKQGSIVWPLERHGDFGTPYAPGLKAFGLNPARFVFLRCARREDTLWAMEEALRLGGCAAVIGTRPERMDLTASRRLALAAEASGTPALLFRPYKDDELSAASTRWRVAPLAAAADDLEFFGRARFAVTLERARSGRTGSWVVEFDHAALCLRLSTGICHRAVSQSRAIAAA